MAGASAQPNHSTEGSIRISRQAAEAIRNAAYTGLKSLPKRGVEVGGFLTSTTGPDGLFEVDGITLIDCEYRFGPTFHLSPGDLRDLSVRAGDLRSIPGVSITGFFRSSTGGDGAAQPFDLDVARDMLPEAGILLVVRPAPDGRCAVRVYRRDAAGVWTERDPVEFVPMLHGTPHKAEAAAHVEQSQNASGLLASPQLAGSVVSRLRRSGWISALIALLLLAAGATSAWGSRTSGPEPGLQMGIEVIGSGLRLTWDRNSPAVHSARRGVLSIDDGGRQRTVSLDASQITSGTILYRPRSDDVSFHLELERASGETVGDSVRMLDGMLNSAAAPVASQARPSAPPLQGGAALAASSLKANPDEFLRRLGNALQNPMPADASAIPLKPAVATSNALRPIVPPATANPDPPKQFDVSTLRTAVREAEPADDDPIAPVVILNSKTEIPKLVIPVPSAAPLRAVPPPPAAEPAPRIIAKAPVVKPPDVTPPRPLKQVLPNPRPFGTTLLFGATDVEVEVQIDATGHVTNARVLKSVAGLLAAQVLNAARQWVFEPAQAGGRNVPSTHTIVFHFNGH